MRRVRVCIYGGTDLQGMPSSFISKLASTLLNSMPAVIITGGYLHSKDKPLAISTDLAALNGAREYAKEQGIDLRECYEVWIPEPSMESGKRGSVRMSESDGVTVRVMRGRTPLGRRLAMVAGVDLVVTISGKAHTEVVVEQALELGVPVFPIPDAGGDSQELLHAYRERIAAFFGQGALDRCLRDVSSMINSNPGSAADAVVNLLRTAKIGRCLVLLPYDPEHDDLYQSSIEPSVSKHMIPVRLDRLPRSEAIYTSFADAIRLSSAIIADITLLNENVMYEIGYAHGNGLTPLIYTRDPARLADLPVYFRTLNVRQASQETPINLLIDDYLRSFKATRGDHEATPGALS